MTSKKQNFKQICPMRKERKSDELHLHKNILQKTEFKFNKLNDMKN